ncbi:replicative DNA helicase [Candidatus Finniella inopinata]|uniref:Replicative DNA helicase n=1 Tax=Candidatus Finniella inopinata TaxID=1696036 RepID=A0A4Q7DPZ7_9PROT|nr:replicative DNA helicase [Candidatus Finniella inopinata]RZI47106.1 replicative DNA helicase [Candidatus Finniella inopinata]
MTSTVLSLVPQQTQLAPIAETILHNVEAEQALLGALLLNNNSLEHVSDFLRPDHFSHAVHGQIYESIQRLIDRGQIADPITLKDIFHQNEHLATVGGASYLIDLANSVVSIISAADYGRLIYDLYLRRQLINLSHETVQEVRNFDMEATAVQHIESAEKKLYDLATTGQAGGNAISFREALTQAIETAEIAYKRDSHIVGVTTGFIDLDKWLGGLHPSDLLILAGRPSMGKTALATNIAFNAALCFAQNNQDGTPVAFFSLEMSAEQLATRILSSESKVSSDKIRRGEIRSEDFPKFVEISRSIHNTPLFIDDTAGLSIMALRNRARRLKRQHNIGLIVIDYLQLLESSNKRSGDNRVQEISEITRSLKGIAKELNVPVLALSQLSRAVEQRDDKRPQLSDLRESGSIEQDADVVMFVYREEYYESRKQPPEGTEKHLEWQKRMDGVYNKAEVIIAKQRHGPIGTVKLFFDGKLTRFGNLENM